MVRVRRTARHLNCCSCLALVSSTFFFVYWFYFSDKHTIGTLRYQPVTTAPNLHASTESSRIQGRTDAGNSSQDKKEVKPPQTPRKLHRADDWPEFFVPRTQQQFSLEYPYLHRADRACETPVDMMVMTLSLPQNLAQRRAIRETWGSVVATQSWPGSPPQTLTKRLGLIFVLGEKQPPAQNVSEAVRRESEQHGDIVQWTGLHDTYFNLTMKVLLGLKWVTEFCPNVSHVIKTDDDTFVHVPRLLGLLQTNSQTNLIWGPYFTTSPCERGGKYKVSREAYPFDIYPPHVKGNLYVLPGSAVPRMVKVAPYLPYNNMEDTHVTGTLARTLTLRHQAFSAREYSSIPRAPVPCLFEDNREVLGSQMVSPGLAFRFWNSIAGKRSCRAKNR